MSEDFFFSRLVCCLLLTAWLAGWLAGWIIVDHTGGGRVQHDKVNDVLKFFIILLLFVRCRHLKELQFQ